MSLDVKSTHSEKFSAACTLSIVEVDNHSKLCNLGSSPHFLIKGQSEGLHGTHCMCVNST